MPRLGGFGYGYTPVLRAQQGLANTLERGLTRLGDRPLQEAQFGLQEAGLMHDIGRQQAADLRSEKRLGMEEEAAGRAAESHETQLKMWNQNLELRAKQARRDEYLFNRRKAGVLRDEQKALREFEIAEQQGVERNRPLTVRGFARFYLGSQANPETVADFLSQGKINDLLKATGGRLEGDKFVRANGQVATWNDMPQILPIMNDIMKAGMDPGHALDQKIGEYEEIRKLPGAPLEPEAEEWYIQAKKNQKNPQWLLDKYEQANARDYEKITQYEKTGVPTEVFERNIARRNRKIAKWEKKQAATAAAGLQLTLEKIKSLGKNVSGTEKLARWIQFVNPDVSLKEATDMALANESRPEKLKLVIEELKTIDWDFLDEKDRPGVFEEVLQKHGLTRKSYSGAEPEPASSVQDPLGIR